MPWEVEKLSEPNIASESEELHMSSGTVKSGFLLELADAFKGTKTTSEHKPVNRIISDKLELASRIDEIVARCINFYALQVTGPGFEIITNKQDKEFLEKWRERVMLMDKLEDNVRDMCIYGNGWLEKQRNKGKFVNLAYINGKYMDIKRDSFGNIVEDVYGDIVAYTFKNNDGTLDNVPVENAAHFKLFGIGNEMAIGFVEPAYHLILDKQNARNGISQAGWRSGHELIVAKVGDQRDDSKGYPGHKPDSAFMDQIADFLEDIEGKHKMVIPHFVDINKLPSETIDWSPLLDLLDSRIVSAFGIPIELILGTGKSGRASLEVTVMRDVDRTITSIQNKISLVLKNDIFRELMEQGDISEIPEIRWNVITPMDMNRWSKRITEYVQFGIVNPLDVKELVYKIEGFTDSGKPMPKEEKPEKVPEEKKLELADFVIERKHITIEEAILFLKTLRNSFPAENIGKLIDSLIEDIMLKTTGQQIPQESGGIDVVQDGINEPMNEQMKRELQKLSALDKLGHIIPERAVVLIAQIANTYKNKDIQKLCDELMDMVNMKSDIQFPKNIKTNEKIDSEKAMMVLRSIRDSYPGSNIDNIAIQLVLKILSLPVI